MQAQAASGTSSIPVWIERADGTILRGRAEAVSPRGARVVIPHCALLPDEPVVLRVCFSPERPTVGAAAAVRWARPLADSLECGLDWDLGTAELQ